jgi:hypothetical protein
MLRDQPCAFCVGDGETSGTSRLSPTRRHHCDRDTRRRRTTRSSTPSVLLALRYVLHLIDASLYRFRRSGATSVDGGGWVSLVSPGSKLTRAPASVCHDQLTSQVTPLPPPPPPPPPPPSPRPRTPSFTPVTFLPLRSSTDTARTLPSLTVSRRSPFSRRLPGVLPPSTILTARPWASRALGG